MVGWLTAVDHRYRASLSDAETLCKQIRETPNGYEELSEFLHVVLLTTLRGEQMTLLMRTENGNGFEGWRLLVSD